MVTEKWGKMMMMVGSIRYHVSILSFIDYQPKDERKIASRFGVVESLRRAQAGGRPPHLRKIRPEWCPFQGLTAFIAADWWQIIE